MQLLFKHFETFEFGHSFLILKIDKVDVLRLVDPLISFLEFIGSFRIGFFDWLIHLYIFVIDIKLEYKIDVKMDEEIDTIAS